MYEFYDTLFLVIYNSNGASVYSEGLEIGWTVCSFHRWGLGGMKKVKRWWKATPSWGSLVSDPPALCPHSSYLLLNNQYPKTQWVHIICMLSRVWLFVTPWTVACHAPLAMGLSRQEYWIELPFPSPGDLPHPGIEPLFPALAGRFFTIAPPGKPSVG